MAGQIATPDTPPAPPPSGGGQDTFSSLVNSKLQKITGGRKDKFADLVNSKLQKIQAKPAPPAPVDNLGKIEDNPNREGTYAVKVNGQVKQVPFSKLPQVIGINRIMHGSEPFATREAADTFYKDLEAADPKTAQAMVDESERHAKAGELLAFQSKPSEAKPPDPIHEPIWWTMTKKGASAMADLFLGGGGVAEVPVLPTLMKGTDFDPQVILRQQAAKGDPSALAVIELQEPLTAPLANISGTKTFQRAFDPTSKNAFSRFATGTTKALEGMTSIENLYSLASIYAAPESIGKPMGLRFQADLATSSIAGVAGATEATVGGEGKEGDASEAWGQMFGNVLTIAAMHYGEHAVKSGVEAIKERDNTATLNEKAQEAYKKKFGDLTPEQKASVLYQAVEDASPRFKKRVDQEVAKIQAKSRPGVKFTHGEGVDSEGKPLLKKVGLDPRAVKAGVEFAEPTTEEVRQQRLEAAKKLTRQIMERKAREEVYKREAAQREHQARVTLEAQETARQAEDAKKRADEIVSQEDQRGFPVTEGRTTENLPVTGLRKTTEREPGQRYDPEHQESGIPVVDRRSASAEPLPEKTPQMVAADAKVQELTEQQMGQSFSSLSIYRQKVAAEWLEKNHPEAWEAFKETPAYAQHVVDVKRADIADAMLKQYLNRNPRGDNEPLAPGADLAVGTAKLILGRSNIDAVLQADPETYRDLNEHSERFLGKSFDMLNNEQRIPALAEYLRNKPAKIHAFLSVDLRERMESGQHIDLANLSQEQMARQRVQLRMEARDSIRRAMDTEIAAKLITDERTAHQKQLTEALYASLTGKTPSLESVYRATKGLTEQASKVGFGQVANLEDLFRIESESLALPERVRTPAVNEFLTRMRQVRAAAEEHVLRELAETTASQFRADADGAIEQSSRKVIELSSQASDLQQAADDLRATGQTQQADSAQQAADFATQQANAVVAGAQSVLNPAPAPQPKFQGNMAVGRGTRVVYPGNSEGLPAHYVLMEATDAQTSHMPFTYEKREGYDQNGQPRDYSINRDAQGKIKERAASLDNEILLSTDPQTVSGPPVLDQKAHVISANGRLLSVLEAIRDNPDRYARYVSDLRERAATFGIEPTEVLKYKNPILAKMLDAPIESSLEWARLGRDMNGDVTVGMSEAEHGASAARLLSPEFIDRLTGIVNSLDIFDKKGHALTVREAMRERSQDLAKLLQDAGIINPNKMQEYVNPDTGELTEKSKTLIENMLAGLTVTDPAVLANATPAVIDKLTRAGLYFTQMRTAGANWDLASMNTDAVRLLSRVQSAAARLSVMKSKAELEAEGKGRTGATGGDSLVEKYLHPERYLDADQGFSFDGQSIVEPQLPAVEALAMALEEKPREYSTMIADYADEAVGKQASMFGASHPADAFTNKIASKYGLNVAPEEWGAVAPLPETVKAAIEAGRQPLPVEPPVHAETVIADVEPDSSSVTDVMPEGPRTLQELRKVLETHPNLTPEQAEAATQYLEHILPRALGVSAEELMGNRRLNFAIGGKEANYRGYMQMIDDATGVIRLLDSADVSTFLHEVTHYIRKFMKPEFQKIANDFVGAKPGEEWTDAQEEMFTQANERYHADGGLRRGKLEQVFAVLSRAMQSIYNQATVLKLAKGSPALTAMFDSWYDWTRAERKPITARLDVDELEAAASGGKVEIPVDARVVERGGKPLSDKAQNYVFVDKDQFHDFIKNKKNGVRGYELHQVRGDTMVYARMDAKAGKKLYQPSLNETIELARKARDLEAQLKKEQDPRRQALLRGQLNGIEDKMRGATGIIGSGAPEPKDTSVIQLAHGISERPSMNEPTTPAQAVTEQGIHGDPTAIALGGEHGSGKRGTEADGPAGVREEGASDRLPEQRGATDGEHGAGKGKGTPIAKPEKHPLADVKAAKLKAPDRERGTPVVDPAKWREHVEALGLPEGMPPPTVRLDPDIRSMAIYPGQAESIEGALSALQQHDATVLAAGLGTGKTFMNTAIAAHLIGTGGDKVGIIITRSQNLVHEADGYIEWGHRVGLTVEPLPTDMSEIQSGGVYAGTYAQIRGNRGAFSIPWDFAIFDESAEARNWTESDQGRAVVTLGHAAKKVVYSSATPYSTVMEMGYMHKLGLWPKGGFAEWASQFGLKEIAPNTYSGGTSAKKLTKLRQQLIERGQWQTLHKDMDGVEGHVALVPQTEETRAGVRAIRSAFAKAAAAFQKAGLSRFLTPTLGHEAIYLKRYIAGSKLKGAIDLAQKLVKEGWAPILFTEYRSPAEEGMDFFHNLPGDLGAEINKTLPPLPDVVGMMREAFGQKIGIFAGEANQIRAGELEGFQSGEKDAIYMTYGAGAVGANAQDKVGDRPRAAIFIDLPWGGMMFEQGTGRPWRYGSKSNVSMFFLTSDALPEMKLLATKILPRMRSLKAAVYGEKNESQVAKNLRQAVGLPEEMLQYEEGEEVKPQAAEWEQDGEGASFTHLEDLEIPDAKKAKNKGMKYKGQGRKLYQSKKPEGEDPLQAAARAAWEDIYGMTKGLPAPQARAITANEPIIKAEAAEAGRRAMGSGEPVKQAAQRKAKDMAIDSQLSDKALLAIYRGKNNVRDIAQFVQNTSWMLATSGDKVVEKAFKRAGFEKDGIEMKRRMIDFDLRKGLYQGRMQGVIRDIVQGNKLTPKDIELMSKVVEGQAHSDDPRINKAAGQFRKFTGDVRQALADAGSAVVIYQDGFRKEIPYSAIEQDPNYWPRMYDWNKPFLVTDKVTGKRQSTTLSEIMDMPNSDERREKFINQFAEERGISKLQAQAFFEKNSRGIRLAGNVERSREWEIPLYGRDRQAIERYIDQVATTIAATEVHGQFRQKTDPIIAKLPQYESALVNRIVTNDLDPAHLPKADRAALSLSSALVVTGKMFYSPIKVMDHLWKAGLATNTRSIVGGLLRTATSQREVFDRARDCNALLDYSKSAWMREYGLNKGGIGQKFLDFTGFSFEVQASRILASSMGRVWFEKYAVPALRKNPADAPLRRKLTDLYGMDDAQIDRIAKEGFSADDVRRVELGAANWVTGSNRPSEMPPMFRAAKDADPVYHTLTTLFRMTQMLHGFMFKTANLVNRTVFEQLWKSNWKSIEPYHLIGRFAFNAGLAGFALEQLLHLRHSMTNSTEAEIEKRRHEWLVAHPASSEALWWSMANISMAVGIQPLADIFTLKATHEPKDANKLANQHRFSKGVIGLATGIPGQDAEAIAGAIEDFAATFQDTGKHKLDTGTRRENVLKRLLQEEVVGANLIPGSKPTKVVPSHTGRHKKATSRF